MPKKELLTNEAKKLKNDKKMLAYLNNLMYKGRKYRKYKIGEYR